MPEGDVHRPALVRQGVVILAARQVEQVARLHPDLHEQTPLGLLVMLAAERLEHGVGDRVTRPAFVDVPGLCALDVHGVDVVGVEMRGEAARLRDDR